MMSDAELADVQRLAVMRALQKDLHVIDPELLELEAKLKERENYIGMTLLLGIFNPGDHS